MAACIEHYAMIGDCETAALVSHRGSIDWLCWPHFASPACFAALLGTDENGCWSIAPEDPAPGKRRYLDHTLVLETRFETPDGAACLIDFMPLRHRQSHVVRIVRGISGSVPMKMKLALRFDYGSSVPWVTRIESGALRAIAGPDMVVLRSTEAHRGEDLQTVSEFRINAGQTATFVLSYGPSWEELPELIDAEKVLKETVAYWQDWTGRAKLNGEYAEIIERSLITLKALTYQHTGGIVGAPTTSLPEKLGGQRNWDYRYCWLRDATSTLLALMNAGYYDEACAWRDWLLRAVAGSPDQAQIMYGIRGERHLLEWEIDWLNGYENARPVRSGNAAFSQLQLDVYGELADALLHAYLGGIPLNDTALGLQRALTDHLVAIWDQPDQGIWEVRGEPKQFTHSKIMAWVALDRALKMSEKFGLRGDLARWSQVRDEIHQYVCENCFDRQLGSFTQSAGSKELDASLLMMPLVGFLPVTDSRVQGTVDAIQRQLVIDGLVVRYRTELVDDGLPPGEGVFLACSFWLVCILKMMGRESDAKSLFDRLLSLCNDVGLLAEEFDPRSHRQLGNFPQALSHIALINAAFEFTRATGPGKQRSQSSSSKAEIR